MKTGITSNRMKGIFCILLSTFGFALMNACIRLAGDLPTAQKALFRNAIALIAALISLRKGHVHYRPDGKTLAILIVRCLIGTFGLLLNFYAVSNLAQADATLLNRMSPFFAIIFSALLLREKVTPVQGVCLLVAFGGSLLVIKPSFDFNAMLPALAGIFGGMITGCVQTFVRLLKKRGMPGGYIILGFSLISCVTLLPMVIVNYVPMTGAQWAILLAAGLFASLGQFGMTAAYGYAPAKEISVFDYSQVLFAAVLGFFLFDQIPDLYSVLGYIIIIGVGIFVAVHQQRKKPEEGALEAGK